MMNNQVEAAKGVAKRVCTLREDRNEPGSYRVEYVDDDGGCEVSIFAGPDALERAIHFAAAENGTYYDGWNDPELLSGPY